MADPVQTDWELIKNTIKSILDDEDKQNNNLNIVDLSIKKKYKKINTKFCVDWDELVLEYKINRGIDFVARFSYENNITEHTSKNLRKIITEAIVNKTIKTEYDKVKGQIINITNLKYKEESGYFMEKNDFFITRVSKVSIMNKSSDGIKITTNK